MEKKSKLYIGTAGVTAIVGAIIILLSGFPAQASVTTLIVDVPTGDYRQGDIIDVSVVCIPTQYVKAWECKLNFNNTVLNAIQVEEGDFFSGYQTFFNEGIIDNDDGTIINMYNLIIGQGNVTDEGTIVDITFQAVGYGLSNISLYDVGITNETMYIPSEFIGSSVFIYSPYDMNCDMVVNLQDVMLVALHYGETGDPGWIPEDINKNGRVGVLDMVLVACHWGAY